MTDTLPRVVLSDVIADRIEALILDQHLAPGTTLPTEYELMRQYGVGRSAVREAAKVLVQRGLVDVRPGKGMTVAAPLGDVMTRQLMTHLRMSQTSPAQLFEVRELLETHMARSAAQNRTDADLAYLHDVVRRADEAPDDPDAYLLLDLAFHQGLARATQNPFYGLMVSAVFLLLRDPSFAPLRYTSIRKMTQSEHGAILDAIEDRDEELAVSVCLAHLNRVRTGMEHLLAQMRASAGTTGSDGGGSPAGGSAAGGAKGRASATPDGPAARSRRSRSQPATRT